jgi:glycosyltransferase EpsF
LPVILSDTIPVEAIFCNELAVVKKLEDGIKEWTDSIVRTSNTRYNRSDYASKINASPFSIYNSINNLTQIYTP